MRSATKAPARGGSLDATLLRLLACKREQRLGICAGDAKKCSRGAARLLSVSERTQYLFGKEVNEPAKRGRKKTEQQDLFAELVNTEGAESAWREKAILKPGETTLDRLHQSMIFLTAS